MRQAAQKHTASNKSRTLPRIGGASTLPAVPTTSSKKSATELSGVPDDQILPDLVLDREEETARAVESISTEEEMDAATALLSLGEIRDDMLDDDNKNAELMPVGGQNVPIDAALEPIHLDQISVDHAITGMLQSEEQNKDASTTDQKVPPSKPDQIEDAAKPSDATKEKEVEHSKETSKKTEPATKGTLKTKTYALKKKTDKKQMLFQV